MKAALFCLLLVAGTQICRAYPTFGLSGLGGGHHAVESVGDEVSHGVSGDTPRDVPCADGLSAVPPPGPTGTIDSAVNTAEDTFHHGGNAMKHAERLDVHGTSQEALDGSDRAARGAADIMNRHVPGVGTLAYGMYSVPSGISHVAATDASGAAIVASGGLLSPKPIPC